MPVSLLWTVTLLVLGTVASVSMAVGSVVSATATAVMLMVDIATLLLDPSLTVMLMMRLVVLRVPAVLL